MIYLALGAGLLALLVWAGRGPARARFGLRAAAVVCSVLAAAGAVGAGLRGAWPVSLGLIAVSLFLGRSAGRRSAPPRHDQADGGMHLDQAYAILGVGPLATRAEIDEAYRRLIRRAHPDQGGTSGLAAHLNAARDRALHQFATRRPLDSSQPSTASLGQRDVMRQLLLRYGYDKSRVCAGYAAAERRGEAPRRSDMNNMSPEAYANEVWLDGHRPRSPWIVDFCRQNGLKI